MSDPLRRIALAQLDECLLGVSPELRIWARKRFPGSYRELLYLESNLCLMEETSVGHAFNRTVDRLAGLWAEMKTLWRAR